MPVTGQTFQDNLILHIDANWDAANKNLAAFEGRLESFGNTVQATNKAQAQGAAAADKAAKSTDKQAKSTQKATKAGHEHADSLMSQSHSFRRLSSNISTGSLALDEFSMRLDRASMFMWRFNIAMIPLQQIQFQLMAVTAAMGMLEVAAINTYRAVDRMQNTFMGMGDSAAEAGDKVDFLLEKAKTLPFTFEQVSAAAMAFKTSGIAETKEELDKWLNSAADLAAAASTEQGRDIARAAEAMVDAVNGEIRRLRDTYHVSSEEIAKYGEDASDALHALISDKWGGTAEKQMQSLEGSISNFLDSLTRLGVAFGENLKEPLMVFLGIGQKVVEMLTTIVEMSGSVGGGWVLIAATAVPAMGAMAAAVARIYMQIKGLQGGYKILTRDMGNLFNVIARLTAAMNDLAVAEANELAVMEGSELSIKEQIAERNRLIATLEAQGQAQGRVAGTIMAHQYGMNVDVGQEWHSQAMRTAGRNADNMIPAYSRAEVLSQAKSGMGWSPGRVARYTEGTSDIFQSPMGLDEFGNQLARIEDLSAQTGIPMRVYGDYLDKQGKVLSDLTKEEHLLLLSRSKEMGVLGMTAKAADNATTAEAKLAAAREAAATAATKDALLEQRLERFSIDNVTGGALGAFKGGVGAIFNKENWGKAFGAIASKGKDAYSALHTTGGALATTAITAMVVSYSIGKITEEVKKSHEEIDSSIDSQLKRVDALAKEGMISDRSARLISARAEAMREEAHEAQSSLNAIAGVKTGLTILTLGLANLSESFREWGDKELGTVLEEQAGPVIASTKASVRDFAHRRGGDTEVAFLGRRTTAERLREVTGVGEHAGELPYESPYTDFTVQSPLQEEIGSLEARIAAQKEYNETNAATMDDKISLMQMEKEHADLLVKEGKAQRDLAIYTKNKENLLTAEDKITRNLAESRKKTIEIAGIEQNQVDSLIGYLNELGGKEKEVAGALRRKRDVHLSLAKAYKESGDWAQYYQNMTAAEKANVKAATTELEKHVRELETEGRKLQLGNASMEDMYRNRIQQATAMREMADALESLGREQEAEQQRLEAANRELEAQKELRGEQIARSRGMAERASILSGEENKILDPSVFRSRMAVLQGELSYAQDYGRKSEVISANNRILELLEERKEAQVKLNAETEREANAAQDAYYQWSKVAEKHKVISESRANIIEDRYIGILRERIKKEDDVAERIRLQTELIKIQAEETEKDYDDIVRRILGGADVVEEAISTAQLVTRFGPDAIRGAGITSSAAVRVVGSDRSTLTIEIGRGSINRLKDALSGAAADAFTRSFIEDLVKRVR